MFRLQITENKEMISNQENEQNNQFKARSMPNFEKINFKPKIGKIFDD